MGIDPNRYGGDRGFGAVIPRFWRAVTPSDTDDLPDGTGIAIRAGAAGTVTYTQGDGTDNAVSLAAGASIDVMVSRVKAAGTTATSIQVAYA